MDNQINLVNIGTYDPYSSIITVPLVIVSALLLFTFFFYWFLNKKYFITGLILLIVSAVVLTTGVIINQNQKNSLNQQDYSIINNSFGVRIIGKPDFVVDEIGKTEPKKIEFKVLQDNKELSCVAELVNYPSYQFFCNDQLLVKKV